MKVGDKVRRKAERFYSGWMHGAKTLVIAEAPNEYGNIRVEGDPYLWAMENFDLVPETPLDEQIADLEKKLTELKKERLATSYKEGLKKALATFAEKMESARPIYAVDQHCRVKHGDYVFQMTARMA